MNREIKFRAYLKDLNKMEYGLFGLRSDGMASFNTEVDLLKFTGLLDKNGKEIYEGDVLKTSESLLLGGNPPKGKMPNGILKVIFHEGAFKINASAKSRKFLLSSVVIRYRGIEVIGNIYENQNLLK